MTIKDDAASQYTDSAADAMPMSAELLFEPLDKRAFGVAIGAACACLVAGATALVLIRSEPWQGLALLSNYFAGYTVSWLGAVIGAAWAFGIGFVLGWLMAFIRNFTLAVSLFMLRSRVELDETSDFLDHI
jgi:hypothetical protein